MQMCPCAVQACTCRPNVNIQKLKLIRQQKFQHKNFIRVFAPSSKDLWYLVVSDELKLENEHLHHTHEDVTTLEWDTVIHSHKPKYRYLELTPTNEHTHTHIIIMYTQTNTHTYGRILLCLLSNTLH